MAKDLEADYAEYNTKYFGGLLPSIPVRWASTYDKKHAAEYVTYLDDSTEIRILPILKKFGCYTQITILHEMCHVKLRDVPGDLHGPHFQREMRRLARCGAFEGLW